MKAVLFLLAALFAAQTHAQSSGGQTSLCGATSLSVSTTSTQVALPSAGGSCPFLILKNDGAVKVYYQGGASSATATTASFPLDPGDWIQIQASNGIGYLAAITGSGTSTVTIVQSAAPVVLSSGGSSSGGSSGSVSIIQGGNMATVNTSGQLSVLNTNPTAGTIVQRVIATTGTAIALPSQVAGAYEVCEVQSISGQSISYGYSSSITAPSVTPFGNSSSGIYLLAGAGWSDTVQNTNQIYINGNAGDGITCEVH